MADGKAGRGRGGFVLFLLGLVLGVLAAIFAPKYLGDYLPGSRGADNANVTGVVTRKLAEGDRLLLTVVTDSGAVLATFSEKTAEIDLLIEEGDSVTFALPAYAPFVDDPRLGRVAKPVRESSTDSEAQPEEPVSETLAPTDTAAASPDGAAADSAAVEGDG